MHESWPLEMLSAFTFEDLGGRTKVAGRWKPINATAEERRTFNNSMLGMQGGWTGTFEQLAAYLALSR